MAKLRPNQFLLPSGALITELPILFQTEMVKAILANRKTQTRRDRNLDFINIHPDEWELCWVGDTVANKKFPKVFGAAFQHRTFRDKVGFVKSPFGKPGDLLWAKETWLPRYPIQGFSDTAYRADQKHTLKKCNGFPKWKASIHMPKSAARIWLMIEDIRVERLQDISEADAIAEGVIEYKNGTFKNYFTRKGFRAEDGIEILLAKGSFQSLICEINGLDIWDNNPYIWVIRYRVLSKTGRPSMEVIEQAYSEIVNPKSQIREEAVHD